MGKYIFQNGGVNVSDSTNDFLSSMVDQLLGQQNAKQINDINPDPQSSSNEPQYTDSGEGSRFMEMAQDTEKDMSDEEALQKAIEEELNRRELVTRNKINGGDYGYDDDKIAAMYDSAVTDINSVSEDNPLGVGPVKGGIEPQSTQAPVSYNYNAFADLNNRLNKPTSVAASNVSPNQNSIMAYNYYKSKGIAPHVAAAIVGNLYRESGLNTKAKEQTNTAEGRGIAQWSIKDRWPALLKWANDSGRDPYSLTTQLDYVIQEPGEGDRALQHASNSSDVNDATIKWGRKFERPNEKYAAWGVRTSIANQLLNMDNGQ